MPAKRVAETPSLFDLMQRYSTKQSVMESFEHIRWGDKPHCTKCGCGARVIPNKRQPDSEVYTDDADCGPLPNIINQFKHDTVALSASGHVRGDVHTNGMESVWAVLKRGYHGIYHGWSKKHTRAYADEFTLRLNDGNCQIDTKDRLDALFRGLVGHTITFKGLTA